LKRHFFILTLQLCLLGPHKEPENKNELHVHVGVHEETSKPTDAHTDPEENRLILIIFQKDEDVHCEFGEGDAQGERDKYQVCQDTIPPLCLLGLLIVLSKQLILEFFHDEYKEVHAAPHAHLRNHRDALYVHGLLNDWQSYQI
jgi:hypothetical protein